MKRILLLTIFLTCLVSLTYSQSRVRPNTPYSVLNSNPGFVSINEVTAGSGLGGTTRPYTKSFIGFTTVVGYKLTSNFTAGVGTGLSFYDAGLLVPLFLDFRYTFMDRQLTPYLWADGGMMINTSDFGETKLFLNPGAGARYSFSRWIAVNGGVGIITQVDGKARASFLNFKIGGVYVF